MSKHVDVLVLDAHGLLLNEPMRPFLRSLAEQTDQDPEALLARWDYGLRKAAWTDRLDDRELWRFLAGRSLAPLMDWRSQLEVRYTLGPAAQHLDRWLSEVPVWLLSNHRSHWLLPRLARFGLLNKFERILTSDMLGYAKPSKRVFDELIRLHGSTEGMLVVDAQRRNVLGARSAGLRAIHFDGSDASLRAIDRAVVEAEPVVGFGPELAETGP